MIDKYRGEEHAAQIRIETLEKLLKEASSLNVVDMNASTSNQKIIENLQT